MADAATILVVDDERDLVDLVRFNLQRFKHRVLTAFDGEEALEVARRERPDLILLDILLPKKSGREVIVELRGDAQLRATPVIMLTALAGERDVVLGLHLGADDYVNKPFSIEVLLARISALLRRRAGREPESDLLRAGPMVIDRGRHCVEIDGKRVSTTLMEFRILDALASARSRVLSRDQLMTKALGPGITVTDRTIDVHITALRRKLGPHRDLLETVRGVGYRFADVWHRSPASGDPVMAGA